MGLPAHEWDQHPNPRVRAQIAAQREGEALRLGTAMSAELLRNAEQSLRKEPKRGKGSKLEDARYAYHLERKRAGLIASVLRQPRFELTDGDERPVIYTADFLIVGVEEFGGGHSLTVEEVKGSMRAKNARDSRTRFRVAADRNPWARWLWVERERGGNWIAEEL